MTTSRDTRGRTRTVGKPLRSGMDKDRLIGWVVIKIYYLHVQGVVVVGAINVINFLLSKLRQSRERVSFQVTTVCNPVDYYLRPVTQIYRVGVQTWLKF